MRKTMWRRSLALGALMAFVITGSAMAENSIGVVKINGEETSIDVSSSFSINNTNGSVDISNDSTAVFLKNGTQTINIDGQDIAVNSINGCGFQVSEYGKLILGSETTKNISIKSGDDGFRVIQGYTDIQADNIDINIGYKGCAAVWLQNNTQDETAPSGASFVNITANKINIDAVDRGLVAYSNGQMRIIGDLTVNAPNALDVRGNSTVNINTDGAHKTVLNGDIVFETPNAPGDPQNSGNLINAYVNVNFTGEESAFNGRAYKSYRIKDDSGNYVGIDSIDWDTPDLYGEVTGFQMTFADGAAWNMKGDSFINDLTLQDGGVFNVQEGVEKFNANELTLNDGIINLQGSTEQVATISNLAGDSGTVSVASDKAKMLITKSNTIDSLTATATQEYTEQLASEDMAEAAQTVANQITDETATTDTKTAATDVYLPETAVTGVYTADVIDGYVTNGKEAVNSSNAGISNMGAIALMTWRQENNDMNKRLGELRDSAGEHGVWVRMTRGEGKYKSIKNQYNSYQIGYDEKLSVNKNWTVGAALTYTDGESSFAQGNGENTHKGLALYGSYLSDDGSFIDLIAKYSRLEHEFDTIGGAGKGDYETNGYSLSAEYGKRFTKDNGLWIEPQVELTYGKVGSADYLTSRGVKVRQDGMDSLVGRLGFALGKDLAKDKGNVYLRASYLYDFDGETDMRFSKDGVSRTMEQDLGGGWWEVGVGANVNLSAASHLYVDVEKTYGGDVATPWQWNAGVRWSF